MKNNKFICLKIFKSQMILQKNTKNMRVIPVMKISGKCHNIAQYQKTLTKAYLMNGMIKLYYRESILQKNTISKEQD